MSSFPEPRQTEVTPVVSQERSERQSSYGQILRSTALVGGSQVMNIAIGVVRTKVMAMLLGPAGFGLAGLYLSVGQLTQSLVGMGVNQSGVRQIAAAVGSGDAAKVARTAAVLRRTSWVLGLLGAAVLILGAAVISKITFGNAARARGVAVLGIAVLLNLVSAGQGALLQGTRKIADLAKMSVLGALFGTLAAIPLVYFLREDGVVPSLVATAAMTLAASWWYSRKVEARAGRLTLPQIRTESAQLLKLGLAFMASGLMTMGSAYIIRILISNKLGLEATGLYQAAWTLGGLYVGMILQAMGADFYPRLTAAAHDHVECGRLANEQARVSVLLAAPGILATLTFAPLVISLFYAPNFGQAVGVLRWLCLGIAMRVISWPLGYILVAKGEQTLFLLSDISWTVTHLGLAWLLVGWFGLEGAGMAFFSAYVIQVALNYTLARRLVQFRCAPENMTAMVVYFAAIVLVFGGFHFLPFVWAFSLGVVSVLLYTVSSIRLAATFVPAHRVPVALQRALAVLKLPIVVHR